MDNAGLALDGSALEGGGFRSINVESPFAITDGERAAADGSLAKCVQKVFLGGAIE